MATPELANVGSLSDPIMSRKPLCNRPLTRFLARIRLVEKEIRGAEKERWGLFPGGALFYGGFRGLLTDWFRFCLAFLLSS